MRTGFILHNDLLPTLDLLSNAEAGKLIKAVFHYSCFGEVPEKLPGSAAILFSFIRAQLDRDIEKYEKLCAVRSEAGKKSAELRAAKAQSKTAAAKSPPDTPAEPQGTGSGVLSEKDAEALLLFRDSLRKQKGLSRDTSVNNC